MTIIGNSRYASLSFSYLEAVFTRCIEGYISKCCLVICCICRNLQSTCIVRKYYFTVCYSLLCIIAHCFENKCEFICIEPLVVFSACEVLSYFKVSCSFKGASSCVFICECSIPVVSTSLNCKLSSVISYRKCSRSHMSIIFYSRNFIRFVRNNFLYLYLVCTYFSECYITKRYSSISLVFNDCLLRQSYTAFRISAYHAHFK